MPSDDSSPIPIYFLSLMLLKSPTRSANREGLRRGGEERRAGGRGELRRGGGGSQLRALRPGFKSPPPLHLPVEPWGKAVQSLAGKWPPALLPQGMVSKVT